MEKNQQLFSSPHPSVLPVLRKCLPEEGLGFVHDALIGVVVSVCEERHPSLRQTVCIHSIAVILGSDQTATALHVTAWLIVTTVTVSKMENRYSRKKGEKSEHI